MRITVEISLYPLKEAFVEDIRDFIHRLHDATDVDILTTQTSTLIRGDFERVTDALNGSMRLQMERHGTTVLVAKYINADLDVQSLPKLDADA